MRWQSLWGIPTSTGINVLPIPIYLLSIIGRTFQQIGARVSVAARLELKPNASGRTILQMNVFLSVLVATLGLGDVVADDDIYPLPLASFVFSSRSASYYLSPYIHFCRRWRAICPADREKRVLFDRGLHEARRWCGSPAPIALFLDGLPQGHGRDPASGSEYVWNVANQRTFETYSADNVYLYAGIHTVGIWCLACSQSAAALVARRVHRLTSRLRRRLEPWDRGIQPSSPCAVTTFGIPRSEAVQSGAKWTIRTRRR